MENQEIQQQHPQESACTRIKNKIISDIKQGYAQLKDSIQRNPNEYQEIRRNWFSGLMFIIKCYLPILGIYSIASVFQADIPQIINSALMILLIIFYYVVILISLWVIINDKDLLNKIVAYIISIIIIFISFCISIYTNGRATYQTIDLINIGIEENCKLTISLVVAIMITLFLFIYPIYLIIKNLKKIKENDDKHQK
ncbi:hypothetical protein B0187_07345 [Haemophilus paracuniculus]|uniref:Transmembrane protein n=1 Tax=Haemophilus paracuniculus TaxID=734 RepID=A0A1T0AR48_9PAST|nr:hypothetical protein [Haemophilus paracuniculus]OOR98691.1 hypothetical protein B0187_07345 [Haemophilus paracuniculus]